MGGPIIIWPPDVCDDAPGYYAPMRDRGILNCLFGILLSSFWL